MFVGPRQVPDQLVLTKRGYVSQETIGPWRSEVGESMARRGAPYGGFAGPDFTIFFGSVRPGQSVVVENCIPIAPGQPVAVKESPRIEPAYREVYARLPLRMTKLLTLRFPSNDQDDASWQPDDPLLSIGDFARRSRLSINALRLYDRQGVLIPAYADPSSGYRQYQESQLETARLVGRLRRLDMPLSLIQEVIAAPGVQGVELVATYWDSVE